MDPSEQERARQILEDAFFELTDREQQILDLTEETNRLANNPALSTEERDSEIAKHINMLDELGLHVGKEVVVSGQVWGPHWRESDGQYGYGALRLQNTPAYCVGYYVYDAEKDGRHQTGLLFTIPNDAPHKPVGPLLMSNDIRQVFALESMVEIHGDGVDVGVRADQLARTWGDDLMQDIDVAVMNETNVGLLHALEGVELPDTIDDAHLHARQELLAYIGNLCDFNQKIPYLIAFKSYIVPEQFDENILIAHRHVGAAGVWRAFVKPESFALILQPASEGREATRQLVLNVRVLQPADEDKEIADMVLQLPLGDVTEFESLSNYL